MEQCVSCQHDIGRHFQSVDGKVRCLHVEHGMSTGVIMPYEIECDCVDYRSQRAIDGRITKEREDREWREQMDAAFVEAGLDKIINTMLRE